MATNSLSNDNILHSPRSRLFLFMCAAAVITLILPNVALAQDATATINTTCGFATNINKILNAISIVVVTMAVIFSGYQIAFAHKRIGDVAPVLIGAVLIGAAGQIANMFLSSSTQAAGATACTASLMTHVMNYYA